MIPSRTGEHGHSSCCFAHQQRQLYEYPIYTVFVALTYWFEDVQYLNAASQ